MHSPEINRMQRQIKVKLLKIVHMTNFFKNELYKAFEYLKKNISSMFQEWPAVRELK